jgi:phosphate transport system substrate-binding protein
MAGRVIRRRALALSLVAGLLLVSQLFGASAVVAQNYVPISGSGSTWSQNALDQWRRNVYSLYGITVQFQGSGSSQGRNDFKFQQTNFAVSEIEYGLTDNNVTDQPPGIPYAYMPIVAGGTAFMYNLKIGNTRVTNLRLSGEVLAKIFTRQITNWADPAIKADNPGLALPARQIVPVVRGEGSGTTAQFTKWMAAKFNGIWSAFCGRPNCQFTSNYPVKPGIEAKVGSTGVANFVQQGSSEGSITYVEYSYAKNAGFPVAKVLNEANYYVEPTAQSVAVALLQAGIKPDLTQELGNVYGKGEVGTDKRSYPLSSYSYMILPTATNSRTTQAHGRTLSDFAYYFLCEGQQSAEALGYSPLPVNLVAEGVKQVARIPGTTNKLQPNNLSKCNNPTVSPTGGNRLAETAPNPAECDKKGATQCTTGTGGAKSETPNSGSGGGGAGAGGGGGGAGGAGGAGGDTTGNGAVPGSTAIDPDTGLPVGANGSNNAANVSAIPVQVALPSGRQRLLLTVFAIALLTALVLGPALVSRFLSSRRGQRGGQ